MRIFSILALAVLCFTACRRNNNHNNVALVNRWNLESLSDTAFSIPDGKMYLQLSSNGTVSGEGGCNGFSGTYTLDGNQLFFRDLLSTLIWCDYGNLETKFMSALNKTNSYTISNGVLYLYVDGMQLASLSVMQ